MRDFRCSFSLRNCEKEMTVNAQVRPIKTKTHLGLRRVSEIWIVAFIEGEMRTNRKDTSDLRIR